eukprot:tig00020927_g16001.t1
MVETVRRGPTSVASVSFDLEPFRVHYASTSRCPPAVLEAVEECVGRLGAGLERLHAPRFSLLDATAARLLRGAPLLRALDLALHSPLRNLIGAPPSPPGGPAEGALARVLAACGAAERLSLRLAPGVLVGACGRQVALPQMPELRVLALGAPCTSGATHLLRLHLPACPALRVRPAPPPPARLTGAAPRAVAQLRERPRAGAAGAPLPACTSLAAGWPPQDPRGLAAALPALASASFFCVDEAMAGPLGALLEALPGLRALAVEVWRAAGASPALAHPRLESLDLALVEWSPHAGPAPARLRLALRLPRLRSARAALALPFLLDPAAAPPAARLSIRPLPSYGGGLRFE